MQSRRIHVVHAIACALGVGALGACNVLTGADDIEVEDGDGESSGAGAAPVGSGSGNVGAGQGGPGSGGAGVGGSSGSVGLGAGSGSGGSTGNATGGSSGTGTMVMCGDAVCDAGEDCASCPGDCGACATCNNGVCEMGEACDNCPADCGACSPTCGNATCDGGESCTSCAVDCADGAGPATTGLDAEEQAFLGIINNYRAQNGLGALTACTSLNRAAQGHSEDMRDQNYFSHDGLNGSSPWDRSCDACYSLACPLQTAMAENIAAGNSGAQATFNQWVNSPGHNANMLGQNFTVIGIGRATGGGMYGVYWTNVFGGSSEGSCN
jgi:uncharacterized protein YkwD